MHLEEAREVIQEHGKTELTYCSFDDSSENTSSQSSLSDSGLLTDLDTGAQEVFAGFVPEYPQCSGVSWDN